jgi:hypothetical protein
MKFKNYTLISTLFLSLCISSCASGSSSSGSSTQTPAQRYATTIITQSEALGYVSSATFAAQTIPTNGTNSAYLISNMNLYSYNGQAWQTTKLSFVPSGIAAADNGVYLINGNAVYYASNNNLSQQESFAVCDGCTINAITADVAESGIYAAVFNTNLGTQIYRLSGGIWTLMPASADFNSKVSPSPSVEVFGLHINSIVTDSNSDIYIGGYYGAKITSGYLAKYNVQESWQTLSAPIESYAVFGLATRDNNLLIENVSYGPYSVNDTFSVLQSSDDVNWSTIINTTPKNNSGNALFRDGYGNIYSNGLGKIAKLSLILPAN